MKLTRIVSNSRFFFGVTILLGFLLPHFAEMLSSFIVPVLVVMMTFSIKDVAFHHIKKSQIKIILKLVIFNYFFLSGLYILVIWLFIKNPMYQQAMFVLAIMPPAIGIISMAYLLKGDIKIAFLSEFVGYVASLVIVPILSLFLFGSSVSPTKMIKVLVYVILIPFIISRFVHIVEDKYHHLKKYTVKAIINICYAISFYIIIGINREVFFNNFSSLIPIILILLFMKFGLGSIIYLYLKKKIKKKIDILYVLFGTFKNGGAATAIVILLFGFDATVPFAINSIILPLYIIFLEWFILVEFK